MKRGAAVAILGMIVTPVFIWAGSSIIANKTDIARLDERAKSNKELLVEIRKDIKYLLTLKD